MRLRIFVDFWNFQLNVINAAGKDYRIDWMKLSPWLSNEASKLINETVRLDETRVYLSFNARKNEDKKLRDWACNTLEHFPGISVILVERKPKNPPICPKCHGKIDVCPKCGSSMVGSIEKGVDTAIVTDMISLAWENTWDVAVLISSDKDYIPAVEMLNRKGFRIINGRFLPDGAELSKSCWANVDLSKCLAQISR